MITMNFLGIDGFKEFGVIVKKKPPIPMADRNVKFLIIPGRNGSLTYDEGTYNDIPFPVECGLVNPNIPALAYKVKAWLTAGQGKLIFSNDSDKYLIAQVVNKFDIAESINTFGEFVVMFNAKPFKYAVDDEKHILLDNCIIRAGIAFNPLQAYNFTSGTTFSNNQAIRLNNVQPVTIINNGTVESDPIITIYGTGAVSIAINGNTFSIFNVDQYVTIDSQLQDAYKDTLLVNQYTLGEFPKLQPGLNTITWTGNVQRIEIQCNSVWK